MKILAVYSIKGGVGKTATAVNLAYLSSAEGYKTLIIDLDPQGASTFYFKAKPRNEAKAKKTFFGAKNIDEYIKETEYENLDILPADPSFRQIDHLLNELGKSKKWLSSALKPVQKEYKRVIIDCPPNITLMSESIFNTADYIVVPVVPTTLSIRTYEQLEDYFKEKKLSKSKLIPFFSMVERRKNLHIETVRSFAKRVKESLTVIVPYLTEVEKMGVMKAPVTLYRPHSDASMAYKKLWRAISKILNK
jgi:chromosome partitioning protein